MTEPYAWLIVDLKVGDRKLPFHAEARDDDHVLLRVGDTSTLVHVDELGELATMLSIVRECAMVPKDDV